MTHTSEPMVATEILIQMLTVIGEGPLKQEITPVVLVSGQQLAEVAFEAACKSDS